MLKNQCSILYSVIFFILKLLFHISKKNKHKTHQRSDTKRSALFVAMSLQFQMKRMSTICKPCFLLWINRICQSLSSTYFIRMQFEVTIEFLLTSSIIKDLNIFWKWLKIRKEKQWQREGIKLEPQQLITSTYTHVSSSSLLISFNGFKIQWRKDICNIPATLH